MSEQTIYLDNNATTPIAPEVLEAMTPFLTNYYFNPGSLYSQAKTTRYAIDKARKEIADSLGTKLDSEIVFTASATESNNMAIRGVLLSNKDRKHIITTSVEHPSVYELCKELQRFGYEVTYLGVNENGELDIKELINAIRPDTAIVSIMHANNETGVIFPIEKLSRIVKMTDPKIIFHTDATQTVGKVAINLSTDFSYVDMLSFSGHKLYAPKGIGVLYMKVGTRCRPLIVGGHQEKQRRSGTENVPYIIGLSKAIELSCKNLQETKDKLLSFRQELEEFVQKNIPSVKINGKDAPRLDSTINMSFEGIEGESIIYGLNEYGICASTGSACSSGSLAPSHVLQAMKVPFTFAHGSLRISFGKYTKQSDIKKLKEALPTVVTALRNISPFWDKEKNCAKNI